jgi:hypothetical protein
VAKRDAVRELLQAIRVGFRWEYRGTVKCSVMDSITFVPHAGEATIYRCSEQSASIRWGWFEGSPAD